MGPPEARRKRLRRNESPLCAKPLIILRPFPPLSCRTASLGSPGISGVSKTSPSSCSPMRMTRGVFVFTGSTAQRTTSRDCRYKTRSRSAQPARLRRCRSFQRRGTFYPGGGRGRPGRRIWCRWHRIPWRASARLGKMQQNIPHLPRKRLVRAARGKRCGHVRDVADLGQRGKDQRARI